VSVRGDGFRVKAQALLQGNTSRFGGENN
jgi:hypothetical protein